MNPSIRTLVACAIAAASPATARADEWDEAQPAWEGVWQGTVGGLPVHMCLDKTPYDQKGAYYYDRVKRLLQLVPGKAPGEWFEQKPDASNGPRWSLTQARASLTGSWSDGRRQLPVRLSRIAGASKDFDGPCGSMAFHGPRVGPVKLASHHAVKNGASYTVWTFKPGPWFGGGVQIESFTLDRQDAGVARVNALLRALLPKPDGSGDWLECVTSGANALGEDGEYSEMLEPTLISQRWLAAHQSGEEFCGGAHPENTDKSRTFDLAKGIEVDPLDWLGPKAVHRESSGAGGEPVKTLTPAFVSMLLKGWKPSDGDCDEAMRTQEYWSAGIERGALVFTPDFPRVIMACAEDFKLSFARVQLWLNDKGKAAIATLPR